MWIWILTQSVSLAGSDSTLTWNLTANGARVGTRTLTIRTLEGDAGTNRILESYTDLNGRVGPLQVRYRQRMTAHVNGREPASFHSVVDANGALNEVQGRWTPGAWVITQTSNGRSRTTEMPAGRIDLSTADLFDPFSQVALSRFDEARILATESGDVLRGPVEKLGVSEVVIGPMQVQVSGYAWSSPSGRSEFYFSTDGFLVKYQVQLLGVSLDAVLASPPPGGVDDFPVAARGPIIEAIDL